MILFQLFFFCGLKRILGLKTVTLAPYLFIRAKDLGIHSSTLNFAHRRSTCHLLSSLHFICISPSLVDQTLSPCHPDGQTKLIANMKEIRGENGKFDSLIKILDKLPQEKKLLPIPDAHPKLMPFPWDDRKRMAKYK